MPNTQHIGACALLVNADGQVLLGKRKNNYKAGYFGLPGGHVEVGERVVSAIKREVTEETGLLFEEDELRYVGVIRENQGSYDFIHFVYVVENVKQQPQLCEPEKCEGWQWINIASLTDSVLPGHLAAVTLWQEKKNFKDVV